MTAILVLDTETTGLSNHPVHKHPQVISLAYLPLDPLETPFPFFKTDTLPDIFTLNDKLLRYFFKPSMPISREATAIHGIEAKTLVAQPRSETVLDFLPKEIDYILGHNIQYDHRCLGKPEVKLICTLGLSKLINKTFSLGFANNQLDYLVEFFYPDFKTTFKTPFHDAGLDVLKTVSLLTKLLSYLPSISSYEELYIFQQNLKKVKK